MGVAESELTPAQFARITGWLHEHSGIRLREGKEGLVRARLSKRLRQLGLTDFSTYLARVESDPDRREFAEMIDALTTNKTSFLRERAHFDFLRTDVFPSLSEPIRLWSAGCASGEEAYTLAMLALESFAMHTAPDIRVLATDISRRVLSTAAAGIYPAEAMADVPTEWLSRYWTCQPNDKSDEFVAGRALRQLVHFAPLNLMERWPMHGPFDAIFCRNVMIYFDKGTQQRLVERFHALLKPGGFLFVGHSESLTGLTHRFGYVQPAVYLK